MPEYYEKQYGKDSNKTKIIKNLEAGINYIESNPKVSITNFLKADINQEELDRFKTLVKSVKSSAKEEGRHANINDLKLAIEQHLKVFLDIRERDLKKAAIYRNTDPNKISFKKPGMLFEVDVPEEYPNISPINIILNINCLIIFIYDKI